MHTKTVIKFMSKYSYNNRKYDFYEINEIPDTLNSLIYCMNEEIVAFKREILKIIKNITT